MSTVEPADFRRALGHFCTGVTVIAAKGDTITAVNGKSVASGSDLTTLMFPYHPGDGVNVGWVDASGGTHNATVNLVAGPPA